MSGRLTLEEAEALVAELRHKLEGLCFPPDKGRCDCCGRGVGEVASGQRLCWTCQDRARLQTQVRHLQLHCQQILSLQGQGFVCRVVDGPTSPDAVFLRRDLAHVEDLAQVAIWATEEEARGAAEAYRQDVLRTFGVDRQVQVLPVEQVYAQVRLTVPVERVWR